MNNKYFTIGQNSERIMLLWMPQFESLVHYNNIKDFVVLDKPSNLFLIIRIMFNPAKLDFERDEI